MEIYRDFKELLELFNAQKVEYLIVGGYALAHHGAPRYTRDIDLYVRPTRKNAERAYRAGQSEPDRPVNPKRSRAITKALQREGHEAASHDALSQQTRQQAKKRSAAERNKTGRKATRTRLAHQTAAERKAIARKDGHD